jgi:hypothetical protein
MFNLEGTATILSMAADGFQFAGTTSGMTRSDWNEWQAYGPFKEINEALPNG